MKSDLLTKSLVFDFNAKSLLFSSEFDIFPLVKNGKINELNDYI